MREEIAIACTLSADERGDREAEFRAIAALIRSTERTPKGMRLRFDPSPSLVAQLQDLTDREQACCPFFDFRIDEAPLAVWLVVAVPAGAEPAIDRLFGALPAEA